MKTLFYNCKRNYEYVSAECDDILKITSVVNNSDINHIYEDIYDYSLDVNSGLKRSTCTRLLDNNVIMNYKKLSNFPKNLIMREDTHQNLNNMVHDNTKKYTIINGKSYVSSIFNKYNNDNNNFSKDNRKYDKNGNISFRKIRDKNSIKIYHYMYDSNNKPIEIIVEDVDYRTGINNTRKYLYSYEYYDNGNVKTINNKIICESNKQIYHHCSYNYDEHGYIMSIIDYHSNNNVYIEYIDTVFNNFNYDINKFIKINIFDNTIYDDELLIDDNLNIIPTPDSTKYISKIITNNSDKTYNYTINKEGYYLITKEEKYKANNKIINIHHEFYYDKNNLVLDKYISDNSYLEIRISYDDLNRQICESKYTIKDNDLKRESISLFKYESDYSDEFTSKIIIYSSRKENNFIEEHHIVYDDNGRIIETIDSDYSYDSEDDASDTISKFIENTSIIIK